MKTIPMTIRFIKRNFHIIIAAMAASGIISCVANLLWGGSREDAVSIIVNIIVILLFAYYLITQSIKHYHKMKKAGLISTAQRGEADN